MANGEQRVGAARAELMPPVGPILVPRIDDPAEAIELALEVSRQLSELAQRNGNGMQWLRGNLAAALLDELREPVTPESDS